MRQKSFGEAFLVFALAAILTVATTFPLALQLGHVGRIDSGDGQWSIWVVNWIARTLVVDPLHVFDANIFYPHRGTLAYSETNLVTGALAVPFYWATKNPYLAHNVVLLLTFVLAAAGAYYLARYLTGSRPAAAIAAAIFAFCPYVFAHTAHIHLEMTAGLPLTLLAFHRLVDAPSLRRAAPLGTALAFTGLSCGYYGVYGAVVLCVLSGYYLVSRRYWRNRRYYLALAVAALIAAVLLFPFVKQYADLGQGSRPARLLKDQYLYSANWAAYVASGGFGQRWMLRFAQAWTDVVFPGFTALLLAGLGVWIGLVRRGRGETQAGQVPDGGRRTLREAAGCYALLTAFAFWLSFGPKAGLYSLVYYTFPFLSLLRAPVRLGLIVTLGVGILAAIGAAHLLAGRRRAWLWAAAAVLAVVVESTPAPLVFTQVPPDPPLYHTLAQLPPGAVVEFPYYWRSRDWPRHTYYMRLSTSHWKPLVNGYSDYFPPDFVAAAGPIHSFPSREAFDALAPFSPRYVVVHLNLYDPVSRATVLAGLGQFEDALRPLASDGDLRLYEIVAWPK